MWTVKAGRELRDHLAQHPSFTGGHTEPFPKIAQQNWDSIQSPTAWPVASPPHAAAASTQSAPRQSVLSKIRTVFHLCLDHGSGSGGIGLLDPVSPMCLMLLDEAPGSPEARSLPAKHARTRTRTVSLWLPGPLVLVASGGLPTMLVLFLLLPQPGHTRDPQEGVV